MKTLFSAFLLLVLVGPKLSFAKPEEDRIVEAEHVVLCAAKKAHALNLEGVFIETGCQKVKGKTTHAVPEVIPACLVILKHYGVAQEVRRINQCPDAIGH